MSLLDFKMPGLETAEGQGLMAAALSLLQAQKMPGQRGGFANALGGAGQQYMQASGQARNQAMQQKLQGAQLAQYEAQTKEREQKLAQEKAAQAESARINSLLSGAGQVPQGLGAGLPADSGLPPEMQTGQQVPALRQPGKIDFQSLYRQGVPFDRLKDLASASDLGRAKVKNVETININGKPMKVGIDEFGQQVAQIGMEWKPMEFKDFGGDVRAYDPANPDAGFKSVGAKTMTFADKIAQGQLGVSQANLGLSRERPNFDKNKPYGGKTGPMSVTLQKELLESDDVAESSKAVIGILEQAKKINKNAYSGYGAKTRAVLASNLPGATPGADATIDLDNMMTGQALESLKSVFGGMPTEGERKILLDMQASADKTPAQRESIMDRALAAARRRGEFANRKASSIRDGSYLTEGVRDTAPVTAPSKPPMKGQTVDGYKFKGGDPSNPASWEKQ